jgi:hypothetical protein
VLCRRRILTAPSTPPKPISAGSQGTWFRGFDSIRNTHHYRDSFTGSAGLATISKSTADLVTDSRYWFQAEKEVDENWDWITVSVFTLLDTDSFIYNPSLSSNDTTTSIASYKTEKSINSRKSRYNALPRRKYAGIGRLRLTPGLVSEAVDEASASIQRYQRYADLLVVWPQLH